MTIYRNANWTRRNHECTNVVYQVAPEGVAPRRYNGDAAPKGEWVEADAIPGDMQKIGGFAGFTFYGYF